MMFEFVSFEEGLFTLFDYWAYYALELVEFLDASEFKFFLWRILRPSSLHQLISEKECLVV